MIFCGAIWSLFRFRAAAAADVTHSAKAGLLQAFGVFVDTIVICSCSAMIMLLAPAKQIEGLAGMDLLQEAGKL